MNDPNFSNTINVRVGQSFNCNPSKNADVSPHDREKFFFYESKQHPMSVIDHNSKIEHIENDISHRLK